MARQKKNNLIVYGLVTVIVVSFLYLLFNKRSEGFAVEYLKNVSTDPTKLVYQTTAGGGGGDVRVSGSDLVGKTIKDFYVEYKACDATSGANNDGWIRSSVCGSGTVKSPAGCRSTSANCKNVSLGESTTLIGTNQPGTNFDGGTDRGHVIFEAKEKEGIRLRSSFFKRSGAADKIIRDCPDSSGNFLGDTSKLTSVTPPDTIMPASGNETVPYVANETSLIKKDKGLIFKKIKALVNYGNDPGKCDPSKGSRINTSVKDNIRITILV